MRSFTKEWLKADGIGEFVKWYKEFYGEKDD